MTIFLKFRAILGHFRQFLANCRYPKHEMFFPCIIFNSMTFTHQFSCFNIHDIQKLAFFGQIFTKWGPFWVPRFLKKIFIAMFFNIMYVGRIFGYTIIYLMALKWRNGHFWEILGNFGLFWVPVGTQNIKKKFSCIIFSPRTFSQQP